jgi:hypothetical protein
MCVKQFTRAGSRGGLSCVFSTKSRDSMTEEGRMIRNRCSPRLPARTSPLAAGAPIAVAPGSRGNTATATETVETAALARE